MSETTVPAKYEKEYKDNKEAYKKHPELAKLFLQLSKAKQDKEIAEQQYNNCRENIGKILRDCNISKVFNMIVGFQVTISQSANRKTHKFNEEKFKKEHPKLYAKYLETTSYHSYGGQLTAKKIDKKSMENYKILEDNGVK